MTKTVKTISNSSIYGGKSVPQWRARGCRRDHDRIFNGNGLLLIGYLAYSLFALNQP